MKLVPSRFHSERHPIYEAKALGFNLRVWLVANPSECWIWQLEIKLHTTDPIPVEIKGHVGHRLIEEAVQEVNSVFAELLPSYHLTVEAP